MDKLRVYVSGYDRPIRCFELNPVSGELKQLSVSDGGETPSYLAWNPAMTRLYSVNETRHERGKVSSFAIDPDDGSLKPLGTASSGGQGPCHLSVHPGGKWVFAANYRSGHVAMLPVGADGAALEPSDIHHPGEHAHMARCDAAGAFLFVPCLGSDLIAQFRVDLAAGRLVPNALPSAPAPQGSGPRHLTFVGDFAYVINELDNTIATYSFDQAQGTLRPLWPALSTLPEGFAGKSSTAHILSSPSGDFLYGSNRGHDSVAIFRRGPDGKLTPTAHETGGGELKAPRCFALTPDGGLLLAASMDADRLTVFKVDRRTGALQRLHSIPVDKQPSFVGVMLTPT